MLDVSSTADDAGDDEAALVERLTEKCAQVMKQQQLSAAQFLARFFEADMLSEHASTVLSKSAKGSSAQLAERIANEWAKNKPFADADDDEVVEKNSEDRKRKQDPPIEDDDSPVKEKKKKTKPATTSTKDS
eukprot:CAMPEP_0119022032 /NCGR_PEP_ID=MMETSP1176-20130426/27173_1 /TAXON_ID=265551 /ORGANISM="Synedropsis recta cf, Strain CCMP1620" /LENGTH=131 /DNA_ID=CAMNT_0006976765 /DNA_START=1 /DNA_END=396 /DNA_ORIENTATION=-